MYCQKDFIVMENSVVNASVYSLTNIISEGRNNEENILNGLFLAQNIESQYTMWNWNAECGGCDHTRNNGSETMSLDHHTELSKIAINVYPNPNHGKFGVQLFSPEGGTYTISVYDNLGRLLYASGEHPLIGHTYVPISLDTESDSYFFVRAVVNNQIFVQKVIINQP